LVDVCFSTRAMRVEERDASRNSYCTKPLRSAGTSRILEGLVACRGLVEPRERIGLPFLYWGVVATVEVAVEEEE
jgi:hypothetical protein